MDDVTPIDAAKTGWNESAGGERAAGRQGVFRRAFRAVVHFLSYRFILSRKSVRETYAAGFRLIAGQSRRRPWDVGLPFLAHTLAVSELYVRLVEAQRLGTLELASFTTEPACWRRFPGPSGGRVTLKPDAYAVTRLGAYEDHWFIEVDRSTEPASTLMRKCEQYRRYWQTGTEQAEAGIFPRVLFLVPSIYLVLVRPKQKRLEPTLFPSPSGDR